VKTAGILETELEGSLVAEEVASLETDPWLEVSLLLGPSQPAKRKEAKARGNIKFTFFIVISFYRE
jgi:hypothetical protein